MCLPDRDLCRLGAGESLSPAGGEAHEGSGSELPEPSGVDGPLRDEQVEVRRPRQGDALARL